MKQYIRLCYLCITILTISCQKPVKKQNAVTYPMKHYLEAAEYFRQVEKEAQTTGIARYPYIIEISRGSKKLTFIGTRHTRDITQQADSIDNAFQRLIPQIAFNEGGPDKRTYNSRNEAIRKNGETGQVKYLCDSLGIQMLDGDLDVATEATTLFKKHGRKKVLLYLAFERFLDPYIHNWIDTTKGLEESYQTKFVSYLQKNGVKLRNEEKQFAYIKQAYEDYFQRSFDIHSIPAEKFYFLNDGGELTEVGRSSKVVRDIHLLGRIEEAFKTYDKVFVVFGGAHAFVVEPALYQMMEKLAVR